ncbi:hypothetical protein D3C85_1817690 [compost metagenome]
MLRVAWTDEDQGKTFLIDETECFQRLYKVCFGIFQLRVGNGVLKAENNGCGTL